MSKEKVDIIPALDGFFVVYDFEDCVKAVEPVIAWRVETCSLDYLGSESKASFVSPLCVFGEVKDVSNYIGVMNPDGSVITVDGDRYPSLEALSIARHSSN